MRFSHAQTASPDCTTEMLYSRTVRIADDASETALSFLTDRQIKCKDSGEIHLYTCRRDDRALTYADRARRCTDEKYILDVSARKNGGYDVRILYAGARALYYALADLARQLHAGILQVGVTEEYPLFPIRGYIEGFYGTPWKPQQRIEMMRLMSEHRMNAYFYAPKDDPYHRRQWAVPYPSGALRALRRLTDAAKAYCMDFWYCIAPGLDICYSDDAQFALLKNKIRQLYDIGVRRFGLLLDDIDDTFLHAADAQRYAEPVHAHIDLANRLYSALQETDAACEMALCPMQYHGRGDEYYISTLGANIAPRIRLFWTGSDVCSKELTVRDAIRFDEHTRHMPLYWDNFPVNDAEMANEMHLGYLFGREAELYRYSAGLVANCMSAFTCSKIPLLTVADYLWNPEAYDPADAWTYALQTVAGNDAPEIRVFAEHLLTSCLHVPVSATMCDRFAACERAYRRGDVKGFTLQFAAYSASVTACLQKMQARKGEPLFKELAPWIRKFARMEETLRLCTQYLQSHDEACLAPIRRALQRFLALPQVMADFAFRSTVEWILQLRF